MRFDAFLCAVFLPRLLCHPAPIAAYYTTRLIAISLFRYFRMIAGKRNYIYFDAPLIDSDSERARRLCCLISMLRGIRLRLLSELLAASYRTPQQTTIIVTPRRRRYVLATLYMTLHFSISARWMLAIISSMANFMWRDLLHYTMPCRQSGGYPRDR